MEHIQKDDIIIRKGILHILDSANQGKCAHCCRWHYKLHLRLKDGTLKEIEINEQNKDAFEFLLEEEFRPGEYFEVMEDQNGGYMLNSKGFPQS